MTNSLIKLEPQELIKAVRLDPSIMADLRAKKEAGANYLRHAEGQATIYYRISQEAYTKCILWLHVIREHKLWEFGGFRNWTEYIENWIEDGAKGRTMVLDSLKAVRLWTGPRLDLPPEDLLKYQEGIASIEPLFHPSGGIVEEYNPRTGEIFRLKPEWEARLAGTSPQEKFRALVDRLPKETTKVQTKQILTDDKPPTHQFLPYWVNGIIKGFSYKLYDVEGHLYYEGTVECPEMWQKARDLGVENELTRQFRFPREWMNG